MNQPTPMRPGYDLVVMGGSAGALEPMLAIICGLPSTFDAAILVVTHRPTASNKSLFVDILARETRLAVVETDDGMPLMPGRIHVAKADRHIAIESGRIVEFDGPRTRHWRPAIDDVLASAATSYRSRLIAVILSGAMDDGIKGLSKVWECGGTTLVQDPTEAQFASMPNLAIRRDHPNIVAPAADLSLALRALVDKESTHVHLEH